MELRGMAIVRLLDQCTVGAWVGAPVAAPNMCLATYLISNPGAEIAHRNVEGRRQDFR